MTVPRSQRGYPFFSRAIDRDEYIQKLWLNGYRVYKTIRYIGGVKVFTVADMDGRKGPVSNGK